MSSFVSSRVFAVGILAGVAAAVGCSTDNGGNDFGGTAGTPGASGSSPTAGSGTVGTSGSSNNMAGSSATAGTGGAGTAGTPATGGTPGTAGSGGSAGGGGGAGGDGGGRKITDVWKSDGCGKPAESGDFTIGTMGTKAPDCAAKLNGQPRCGAWGQEASTWAKTPLQRTHHVFLPQNYDPNKPYVLMLQGPGCGGSQNDVYGLSSNANGQAIRVGVKPADPNLVGHATNPGQGCFDDKEGDDSVDFVHYENLYDKLNAELCFDRNRVFAGGNSSGAWWSNELGCKYAGDATRPIRGIAPNTGGLPDQPQYKPTCSTKPMAGMWIHEVGDQTNPFAGNKYAIGRAMMVNGCPGNSFDEVTTPTDPYPVEGRPANECRKIKGCPELYPLIVCPLNGMGHGSHDETVNPSVSTFLQSFLKPPFLTP